MNTPEMPIRRGMPFAANPAAIRQKIIAGAQCSHPSSITQYSKNQQVIKFILSGMEYACNTSEFHIERSIL
jgi:hypothetical protein